MSHVTRCMPKITLILCSSETAQVIHVTDTVKLFLLLSSSPRFIYLLLKGVFHQASLKFLLNLNHFVTRFKSWRITKVATDIWDSSVQRPLIALAALSNSCLHLLKCL